MIVGSRYIDDGGIKGWSDFGYMFSKSAIILSRSFILSIGSN
jgi:hypothetical protein